MLFTKQLNKNVTQLSVSVTGICNFEYKASLWKNERNIILFILKTDTIYSVQFYSGIVSKNAPLVRDIFYFFDMLKRIY